tara:strand:- start:20944 stop:21381 length:438 start_codon:yes stop_codon:yes gene_type:complete
MIGIIKESFDIKALRELEELSKKEDLCLFTDSHMPPIEMNNIPISSIGRSFNFTGILISTCYKTTEVLLRNKSSNKRMFYVRDLEWTQHSKLPYEKLLDLYCSPKVKLVASTVNVYNDISTFFRKPEAVIEGWDFDKIKEIFKNV